MSLPEPAAKTEAQQILDGIARVEHRVETLATALNGLGQNQQWLVDNVKNIFEMFGSPAFMGQVMGAFNGGFSAAAATADTTSESDAAESADTAGV